MGSMILDLILPFLYPPRGVACWQGRVGRARTPSRPLASLPASTLPETELRQMNRRKIFITRPQSQALVSYLMLLFSSCIASPSVISHEAAVGRRD